MTDKHLTLFREYSLLYYIGYKRIQQPISKLRIWISRNGWPNKNSRSLSVFFFVIFFFENNLIVISQEMCGNLWSVVLKLVVGSSEQDNRFLKQVNLTPGNLENFHIPTLIRLTHCDWVHIAKFWCKGVNIVIKLK